MKRIAIIGAGFSGIVLANELKKIAQVKIFEKSRGCGGRMSTRRWEDLTFDHGIQCFTARTKDFQNFLRPFIFNGLVCSWEGRVINFEADGSITPRIWFETHFYASPNMNSLCKKMAEGLDISYDCEVSPLIKKENCWQIIDKNGSDLGEFDFVISSAPAPQTANLFSVVKNSDDFLDFQKIVESKMHPCFSMMLGFRKKIDLDWIFAKVHNSPIKLIAANSSKIGRDANKTCFVIHATNQWSQEFLEHSAQEVQEILLNHFSQITKIDTKEPDYISLHRWRYALVDEVKNKDPIFNKKLSLGATSDWLCNSRIEDVWLCAHKLIKQIKLYEID